MAKKQKTDTGYFWTNPTNGSRFAVVYYLGTDGKRKKKTRGIPAGAAKSKQYEILEELAAETKRQQPTAAEDGHKQIKAHTLTWQQLGQSYEEHRLQPPRFNCDDKLIAGCLSWESQRKRVALFVNWFGPHKRVADLTSAAILKFKETRLLTPVVKKKKKRDPITNKLIRDKQGAVVWITNEIERAIAGVHRDLDVLCALLNHAVSMRWLSATANPWRPEFINRADEKKRETIVAQIAEYSLLDHSLAHKKRRHLSLYLTILFDSACRSAEVRRLRVKHIDFETNEFLVYSYKGPRRTERKIPMTPRVRMALLKACEGKSPDDFAITYAVHIRQPDGSTKLEHRQLTRAPYASWATTKRLANSLEQIDLGGARLHDIRHTTITRLVNSGAPHPEIMKMSGHTKIETFLRYVNPDSTARAALATTLHNYHEAAVVQLAGHKAKAKSA